jgi:hypothetical protein
MLANVHIRLLPRPEPMHKVLLDLLIAFTFVSGCLTCVYCAFCLSLLCFFQWSGEGRRLLLLPLAACQFCASRRSVLVVQLGFQLTFLSFIQLDDRALNMVMNKLFKNYKSWCKFLGRKHSLWYEAWTWRWCHMTLICPVVNHVKVKTACCVWRTQNHI